MINQFKDQKERLTSLVRDSIIFKILPEKRSQFENAIASLEYNQKSEKLVKDIIKFFEEERTVIAQASELTRSRHSS